MEHLEHKQKVTIMIAILAVMFFAAINMTIVGTALPKIISAIGGMEYYDWVFTIYMLTSTISAMLVGKLSDIYGRKIFILSGISIFMIGALLSGTSDTILQLIIYRGIQGFGGGVILSTAFTTVGDLFAPRERGRWQGFLGAAFGLSSLIGPTLGGYIVDYFDWHWVFWVFLPIGVIAFILILKLYPNNEIKEKEPIDFLGAGILTIVITSLLLGFSWGGNKFEWLSIQIISLFVVTILALILLIFVENKAKSPILPMFLFKNSIFTISNIAGLFLGMGMFSAIMYTPFYVQGVMGETATTSGFIQMSMTVSMVVSSSIIGNLITKTGKYKIFGILGLIIMAVGMFLNSSLSVGTTHIQLIIQLIIIGFGLGMAQPIFQLAVQNAVEHKFLGVATSAMQVFRQIGSTLGVAIMGTVMNHSIKEKLNSLNSHSNIDSEKIPIDIEKIQDPQILMNQEALNKIKSSIPQEMQSSLNTFVDTLRESLNFALTNVFLIGAIATVIALIFTFFLKEIPLRTTNNTEDK